MVCYILKLTDSFDGLFNIATHIVAQKSKPQFWQVYYVIRVKNKEGGFREMGALHNRFLHLD